METYVFLILLVLTFAVAALVAIWMAYWDIKKEGFGRYVKRGDTYHSEGGAEKSWKKFFKNLEKEGKKYREEKGIEGELKKWKESLEDEGLRKDGYVWERIEIICRNVDPRHLVRKIPPLSELRGLSLQKEQSCFYSCMFRALIPSILVLGIGCTLFGVHETLPQYVQSECDPDMAPLGRALLPGAFSVLFTIVLFICRGIYNKKLSELIVGLDDLTLDILLPYFQESETHFRSLSQFIKELRTVSDKSDGGNMHEMMAAFCDSAKKWEEEVGKSLDELDKQADRIVFLRQGIIHTQEQEKAQADLIRQELSILQNEFEKRRRFEDAVSTRANSGEMLQMLEKLQSIREAQVKNALECRERSREVEAVMGKRDELDKRRKDWEEMGRLCHELSAWLKGVPQEGMLGGEKLESMVDLAKTMLQCLPSGKGQGSDEEILQYFRRTNTEILRVDDESLAFLEEGNEKLLAYKERLHEQKEDCLNRIPTDLYPSGMKGVYMKVMDSLCRHVVRTSIVMIVIITGW